MKSDITCAIIAITNNEFYLKEWVDYHLSKGFDKIYLITDSSEVDKLEVRNLEKVSIFAKENLGGNSRPREEFYNKVLDLIWNKFNYCTICNVDEFFDFKDYSTVQEFIKKYIKDGGYTVAEIPWEVYSDNNLIHHLDKPIQDLYPKIQEKVPFCWNSNSCSWGKSIFKLGPGVKAGENWPIPHSMNNYGGFNTNHIRKSQAIIKKYKTGCLEDYIKSLNSDQGKCHLREYFDINEVNPDKLLWAMRFLKDNKINLNEKDHRWLFNQLGKFPLITAVIRTYNRLNYLKNCIKSVNSQYCPCSLLVLDDCSTDETSKWLSENKIPHMSLGMNVGPGEILSRGKHLITTPFYIILDDDDVWARNDVVDSFYEVLLENPYTDFIETGYYLHVGSLVSTDLLLECPTLSLWSRDDWYFNWLKNHARNKVKFPNFSFYGNSRNTEDTRENIVAQEYCLTRYSDNTCFVSDNFYNEKNMDEIKDYINKNYHKDSIRTRKVFDQVLNHINKKI